MPSADSYSSSETLRITICASLSESNCMLCPPKTPFTVFFYRSELNLRNASAWDLSLDTLI